MNSKSPGMHRMLMNIPANVLIELDVVITKEREAGAVPADKVLDGMYKYRDILGPTHWEPPRLLADLVKSGHSIADWKRSRNCQP